MKPDTLFGKRNERDDDMGITIRDIAERAGVSVATVSRVINHSESVNEETRKKIEGIIQELNYCPNAAARSLTNQASEMIGLVMPERINPFFVKVFDGVTRRADERSISVLFCKTDDDEAKQEEVLKQLCAQCVKGILITPTLHQTEATRKMLDQIERAGIPLVLIDRDTDGGDYDAIFIDNKGGLYKAVRQLAQYGYQKIAAVTSPDLSRPGTRKIDGFLEGMRDCGLPVHREWIIDGELSVESGYRICKELMESNNRPEAIVAFSSSELIGCVKYLNETGYRIGADISVCGFDDIGTIPDFGLRLITIERPMREMGELAFELLWERINDGGRHRRSREVILPTAIKNSFR